MKDRNKLILIALVASLAVNLLVALDTEPLTRVNLDQDPFHLMLVG